MFASYLKLHTQTQAAILIAPTYLSC